MKINGASPHQHRTQVYTIITLNIASKKPKFNRLVIVIYLKTIFSIQNTILLQLNNLYIRLHSFIEIYNSFNRKRNIALLWRCY